jgi:hypothetical protein
MKARDYIPALKFGAKIYPEDLAGMLGLPYVGNIFYVDPNAGSDSANSGAAQNDALATVAAAYALCTSGKHDVVVIAPTGGTGRTTEAAAITWAKRFTHLIGSCAPTSFSPRAGMNFTKTGAGTTPQFNITENGCIFKNITLAQSVADSYIMAAMTGDYNYFEGVHFAGMQNTTAGDSDSARSLVMTSASENTFVNCTFGVDTALRTGTNYNLEFVNHCARDIFRGCTFTQYVDADAPKHILSVNTTLDRFVLFDGCLFINNNGTTGGSTVTDLMLNELNTNQGGNIIIKDSMLVGFTGWGNYVTGIQIVGHSTNATIMTAYSTGVNPAA